MKFQHLYKNCPTLWRGLAIALVSAFAVVSIKATPSDNVEQTAGGVIVHVPRGDTVKVVFTTEHIVQVSAWPKDGHEPAKSYVVTRTGTLPGVTVDTAHDGAVTVGNPVLRASVDLHTGAVSFADAQGAPLLSEVGRKFTSVTKRPADGFEVEQVFACRPDESLFGLGQTQDGVWNLRGMPVDLRQHNTNIAVPVLVSTAGYGILWDNAARTQFNPVDTPVALTIETAADTDEPSATENLPAKKKGPPPLAIRNGTFTTGEAGEYVFFMQNGDRRDEIGIFVDGKPIFELKTCGRPFRRWAPSGYRRTPRYQSPCAAAARTQCCRPGCARRAGPSSAPPPARQSATTFFTAPVSGRSWRTTARPLATPHCSPAGVRLLAMPGTLRFPGRSAGGGGQVPRFPSAARCHRAGLAVLGQKQLGRVSMGRDAIPRSRRDDPATARGACPLHALRLAESQRRGRRCAQGDPAWDDRHHQLLRSEQPGRPESALGSPEQSLLQHRHRRLVAGRRRTGRLRERLLRHEHVHRPRRPECVGLPPLAQRNHLRGPARHGPGQARVQSDALRLQRPATLRHDQLVGRCQRGLDHLSPPDSRRTSFQPERVALLDHGQRRLLPSGQSLQGRRAQRAASPLVRVEHLLPHPTHPRLQDDHGVLELAALHAGSARRLRPAALPPAALQLLRGLAGNHEQGTFMRALAMDFPQDPQAVAASNEYLFGPAFLVCPVTASKPANWRVYLPRGASWINFWTGESRAGGSEVEVPTPLDQIPLFVRAGSIVPFGPALEYTSEKPADPIELRVYRGADGDFTLYEDEGDSYRYESGARATIACHWDDAAGALTLGKREGDFPGCCIPALSEWCLSEGRRELARLLTPRECKR